MALSNNEAQYVAGVSQQTGIDPRVLVAWIQSEGHPGDEPGYFNYMNIQAKTAAYNHDAYVGVGPANTAKFGTLGSGVKAAVDEINALGLGNGKLANLTPSQAISDIAASGWASSHYGGPGGPNLQNTFSSIFGRAGLTDQYLSPAASLAVASTAGTGSASDWTSGSKAISDHNITNPITAASNAVGSVTGTFGSITDAFNFIFSYRFLEILGGIGLVGIGVYGLMKEVGVSLPSNAVTKTADKANNTITLTPEQRGQAAVEEQHAQARARGDEGVRVIRKGDS